MKEKMSRITDSSQGRKSAAPVDASSHAGVERDIRRVGSLVIETHEHNYRRDEGSSSSQLVCSYVHGDGRVCGYSMTIGLSVMCKSGTYAYEETRHD